MTDTAEYTQEWIDRGADRIGLHRYPEPAAGTAAPLVLICPAMGVPARYYRPFAAELRAAGLGVAVADLRGTGASTPRPSRSSRYGYAELVSDVDAALDALCPPGTGRQVLLLGHSLGGQACALRLARGGRVAVSGLVLIAVGLPYWLDYPGWRRLGVLALTQSINAASALLGVWPGWGFGGRQARGVIRDWARTARTGRFPALGGVDHNALLGGVRTPVLAISVDDDQYTPPSTLDQLCRRLTGAPVQRYHYRREDAPGPLDHFAWVRAGAPLAARIASFAAGR